jgi:hypothetical protein
MFINTTQHKKKEMKGIVQLVFCFFMVQLVQGQKDCRYLEYKQQMPAETKSGNKQISRSGNVSLFLESNPAVLNRSAGNPEEVILIPVVIHILYNNANENISDGQLMSQLAALNTDYRGLTKELSNLPSYFSQLAADCRIEFRLAAVDPKGFITNGIVRKFTSIQNFGMNDRVKFSSLGGDDAWDANKYLNIWVCNLAGGILGYASSPGVSKDKDGVVISTGCFGTTGTSAYPFNLGRTATHEIGHWLNLKHIWGDEFCGDDGVYDTPQQRNANRGCPSGRRLTCELTGNGDMYMNFMDLTDDACMYMFTKGQKERMRAIFNKGGERYDMLQSSALDTSAGRRPVEAARIEESILKVFPNPATNSLTVLVAKENNLVIRKQLLVYNHLGQIVVKQTVESPKVLLDISRLTPGNYFLSLIEGHEKKLVKFTKF